MKTPTHKKRLLISILVILIAVLSATSAIESLFRIPLIRELDDRGTAYLDAAMTRALYTFAIGRSINGVISVIQGTSVAVSPAGVGVDLTLGEILDPVNDLIERFSYVMLISAASLGIQKVLMEMGVWIGFRVLLTLSMALILFGIWFPSGKADLSPEAGTDSPSAAGTSLITVGVKLILVSLVIRFGIPATAIVSEKMYDLFLEQRYKESVQSLEKVSKEIKDVSLTDEPDRADENPGYLDTLKQIYNGAKDIAGLKQKLSSLKDKISDYSKHITNLITVFLLQTMIIPIAALWALIRLGAYIWGIPVRSSLIASVLA